LRTKQLRSFPNLNLPRQYFIGNIMPIGVSNVKLSKKLKK